MLHHSWAPKDALWLVPFALLAVPAVAAFLYRPIGRLFRFNDRVASTSRPAVGFGVASALILLGGILEWALSCHMAFLLPQILASYPEEAGRRIGSLASFVLASGLFCAAGTHGLRTWQRILAKES